MDKEIKKTTLRLPEALYEALKRTSQETGITISQLILFAIWKFTDKYANTTG